MALKPVLTATSELKLVDKLKCRISLSHMVDSAWHERGPAKSLRPSMRVCNSRQQPKLVSTYGLCERIALLTCTKCSAEIVRIISYTGVSELVSVLELAANAPTMRER